MPEVQLNQSNHHQTHSPLGATASADPILLKEKPTVQRLSSSLTPSCCIQPCLYTTTIPTSPVFPLSTLKPRFLRILKQQNPGLKMEELGTGSKTSLDSAGLYCCLGHLKQALQARADELVDEDLTEFARFQDGVMKDLEDYEMGEDHWQDRFERQWTFGERAADAMARFGALWTGWNLGFGSLGSNLAWDPYPFILLNLFLSMLASTQAPVIMMSQNRQAAVDRNQNNFISKAILRNENQTRHVDAKLDHLISYQWKRLLEIQEIQIQLLQEAVNDFSGDPNKLMERNPKFWNAESYPDEFTKFLISKYYDLKPSNQDDLIFSRWHKEGDNFIGEVKNVQLQAGKDHLSSISFEITFPSHPATLDDILQGEVNITFRNDFNLSHMTLLGRIYSLKFDAPTTPSNSSSTTAPTTILNGEFPPRYKPAFVRHRPDRITDLWKSPVTKIQVVYIPPPPVALVHIPSGMQLGRATASVFGETKPKGIYMKIPGVWHMHQPQGINSEEKQFSFEKVLKDVFVDKEGDSEWQEMEFVEVDRLGHFPVFEVCFEPKIVGPCVIMLKSERRIAWQGVLEKVRHGFQRQVTEQLKEDS